MAPIPKKGLGSAFAKGGHFHKYVHVFGVTIVAHKSVPDNKVLHAANVVSQYVDNDGDGYADNVKAACWTKKRGSTIFMSANDAGATKV